MDLQFKHSHDFTFTLALLVFCTTLVYVLGILHGQILKLQEKLDTLSDRIDAIQDSIEMFRTDWESGRNPQLGQESTGFFTSLKNRLIYYYYYYKFW